MWKSYLKIAWRNLWKQPLFAGINVAGLAIGLCFTLLIGVYIWQENSVNQALRNLPQQYIIQSNWKQANQGVEFTSIGALAEALKQHYPHLVANYYRFDGISGIVHHRNQAYRQSIAIGDSTLFTMYGFELLYGDGNTALNQPNSAVISEELALKYFGRTNVLNERLELENFNRVKQPYTITGVSKKQSRNSVTHLNDDNHNQFFIPATSLAFFGRSMGWNNPYIACYIELQPGVGTDELSDPMQSLIAKHAPPEIAADLTAYLLPLEDYYQSANNNAVQKMTWIMGLIAAFILVMAIINFINLTISRSTTRIKEIGIRTVLGSGRKALRSQFILESVVLVTAAMAIALLGYILLQPAFEAMIGKPVNGLRQLPIGFFVLALLLIPTVGIIAGIYPSLYLSALPVTKSLKGQLLSVAEKGWIRKALVSVQFVTAAVVVCGAVVITQQINYFFSNQLGYNKDFMVAVQVPRNWTAEGTQEVLAIRNRLEQLSMVESATLSYQIPSNTAGATLGIYTAGRDSSNAVNAQLMMCDENFAGTYGIQLAAGKFFAAGARETTLDQIVINEEQSAALGFEDPQQSIGKSVRVIGFDEPFIISGVLRNFHLGSMQLAIQPQMYLPVQVTNTYRYLSFKLRGGNAAAALNELKANWQQQFPATPFEYAFLDNELVKLYKAELQLKRAGYTALVLSLVLVLLGITGLVSITLQKRVKEIGIRKVLGAGAPAIIKLFLGEFLLLASISTVIAVPIAWWLLRSWLNEYAYRIELTPLPFLGSWILITGATSVLISWLTYRQSQANPAKSIRTE